MSTTLAPVPSSSSRQQRSQRHDRRRAQLQPWRNWYKLARWASIRETVLAEQPVCMICHRDPSTIVDHVYPHRGIWDAFWVGPFQGLCSHCHNSIKQSWEIRGKPRTGLDGWPIDEPRVDPFASLILPSDLKPSRPTLTIIAGPPASGKSTYIQDRGRSGDAVVDLDLEAKRLGFDRYNKTETQWKVLLDARNRALAALNRSMAPRAWFCFMGADAKTRQDLSRQLKPTAVVIMLTPVDECLRRIEASRRGAGQDMKRAVVRWHQNYTPRGGETIIRWRSEA